MTKLDDLARQYKAKPTTENENLLAAECLEYIKRKVRLETYVSNLKDPDGLESFLCLRVIRFLRNYTKKVDKRDFEGLLIKCLNRQTKTYYTTSSTKISKTLMGHSVSEETKRKISEGHKGMKYKPKLIT